MHGALVAASWVVIVWGIHEARSFLIPMLLAVLLAFLMAPLANELRRRKIPEWGAVTISSLVLFLPAFTVLGLIVNESRILIRDYPALLQSVKTHWAQLQAAPWVARLGLQDFLDLSNLSERLGDEAGKGVTVALEALKTLGEAGAHLVLILVFAVLMLASRERFRKSVSAVVGASYQSTLNEVTELIERFLIARLGIAVGVALVDFVILKIFGIGYSVILACLLGAATVVPIVGFIAAVIPPFALSVTSGQTPLHAGLLVLLLYAVASVESHFVSPKVLGKRLNLNLLVTFIALFAGELVWGIWGMVLSIPILGIVRILIAASKKGKPWATLLSDR